MTKQTPVRNCGETIAPEESDKRFARAIVSDALSRSARPELQPSLDEVGTPASGGHWVIVDLETTGLSADAEITEIGAVRVRDGHLSDEFSSLVCPSRPIPPFITSLTGITPAMVKDAEPIAAVLERFIDWAGLEDERAPVLVAHNASFDVGFLRRAARAAGRHWPKPPVVDTLALARLALPRPLVRNHKLATIASYFGTATTPGHRALGDARATAEVLLGFIDLLTSAGVTDVEDLVALSKEAPTRRPTVPSFVSEMPTTPGVYHFINASGDTLYVGSASSLRSRVSSYYTRAEKRQKIQRMVSVASGVRTFPTSSILEARIRELRDIASLAPPYNSASRRQACQHWVVRNGHRAIVTPGGSSPCPRPFRYAGACNAGGKRDRSGTRRARQLRGKHPHRRGRGRLLARRSDSAHSDHDAPVGAGTIRVGSHRARRVERLRRWRGARDHASGTSGTAHRVGDAQGHR